ncbi:coth protein-domain-containing protein [Sporodiniella umbellata]|nr:coth protein-domain-containing protein [Sporodiniella umbellata]
MLSFKNVLTLGNTSSLITYKSVTSVQTNKRPYSGLFLLSVTNAQQAQESNVEYNVIALLNQTTFKSMAVIVDNVAYPLVSNSTFPILYSGKAPQAQSGYHYAKLYSNSEERVEEAFLRQSVNSSTPHEFFNRTWNTHENAKFPQVYPDLESIHRINSNLHRDNEIPTIHIVGNNSALDRMHQKIQENVTVAATISYLSLHDAYQFQDVEVSLAGNSARLLPKLSYNLKLKKKDDLYGYRRLKLRSLGFDPSYIREQLSYDFIKSMGLPSSQFSYVRVFMNDRELGLFGIIDPFKNGWLSTMFASGDSSYKNGNLYQSGFNSNSYLPDLSYINNKTAYADGQYKIKEKASGNKKDNFEPLMDLTKFIAEAPTNTSDAVAKWNEMIDTDSILRFFTLDVLAAYVDGYLSNLNNYYIYQDPKTNKFTYMCADMDLTFGSSMVNLQKFTSGNYSAYPGMYERPLSKQILRVPEFEAKYRQIIQNTTNQLFNPDATNQRIDDLVNMIKEDIEWDKTLTGVNTAIFDSVAAGNVSWLIGGGGSEPAVPTNSTNQPVIDKETILDLIDRLLHPVSLDIAINGPTGHISLFGVKEWIRNMQQNVSHFFSQ